MHYIFPTNKYKPREVQKVKENLVYALALFPMLDFKLVNISIMLFLIGCLLKLYEQGFKFKRPTKNQMTGFLILTLPFFLNLIALIWTENGKSGGSFVERTLPFLIIPIAILICGPFPSKESIYKFVRVYLGSNIVLSLVVLLHSVTLWWLHPPKTAMRELSFSSYFRDTVESIPIVGEHPIYLSLLVGSALLFLVYVKFESVFVNVAVAGLYLTVILICGSRAPTIALLIALIGVIFLKRISCQVKFSVLVAFLVIALIGVAYSPLKTRMMEFVNTKHIYPTGDYFNSFNTRMGIYNCSYEIGKTMPWYGLAPGDVQDSLDKCYRNTYETNAYDSGIFNTHSQYLFYWLSFGFLGLLLIFATYAFFFRQAFLVKDKVYIIFLAYVFLCFLFENILSRNTGIMLFVIFNTMFFCQKQLKDWDQ